MLLLTPAELVRQNVTVAELQMVKLQLDSMRQELTQQSMTALPPTQRLNLAKDVASRDLALKTLDDVLAVRLSHTVAASVTMQPAPPPPVPPPGSVPICQATSLAVSAPARPSPLSAALSAASSLPPPPVASQAAPAQGASSSSTLVPPAAGPITSAPIPTPAPSTPTWPAPSVPLPTGYSQVPSTVSSHSAPAWSTGSSNPFAPGACLMGPDYYLSFPPPWNVVPQQSGVGVNEILKLAPHTLPSFAGDRQSYLTWRSAFIPCVHLTTINLSFKFMLLRSSIQPTDHALKEFLKSLVFTPEGYREAIVTLEENFGGDENRLLARQEDLLHLPILREGDLRTVRSLHSRLGTYLLEWRALAGDAESFTLFSDLAMRIDKSFFKKYIDWTTARARSRGLATLHEWLAEQLASHRTVDQFYRARAEKKPEGDVEGAKARNFPPSSTLDRNFRSSQHSALLAESLHPQSSSLNEEKGQSSMPASSSVAAVASGSSHAAKPLSCLVCKGPHKIGHCFKFKDMTPAERKSTLAKDRRCFLCFQKGHLVPKCTLGIKCNLCGRKHNTLLHTDTPPAEKVLVMSQSAPSDLEGAWTESHNFVTATDRRVSLRTITIWVENPLTGVGRLANAMLDDGCTAAALVSETLARDLDLKGERTQARTEGVGGNVTQYQTILAPLRVAAASGQYKATLLAQVMSQPAGSYIPINWNDYTATFSGLSSLPIQPPVGGGVEVLIGNRNPALSVSLDEIALSENGPVARRTPLGWTVIGPTWPATPEELRHCATTGEHACPPPVPLSHSPSGDQLAAFCFRTSTANSSSDKLWYRLLKRMLEVEDPGEVEMLSPREEYVIKTLRASTKLIDGRYQVGCTWAPGNDRPHLSYEVALRRLDSLERSKYFAQPELRAQYADVFKQWKAQDFVKIVPYPGEQAKNFIPHFPILKESSSTPVRPVMDCAVEMNKYLLAGPNLLNEVDTVLLRFRSGLYAVSGDIKQMFLRIYLTPEDRPFHCFLWRDTPTEHPLVYQFQVHVFGNAGSPCVAVYTIKEHANKYTAKFPVAVESLKHSTLIDDLLDSADTLQDAQNLLRHAIIILQDAGMHMTKFYSNSPEVLTVVPPADVAKGALDVANACAEDGAPTRIKTLGISYDPMTDAFLFRMDAPSHSQWTKRKILKTFPLLFDPLGLLLPFTMVARIVFSVANKHEKNWDKPLTPDKRWPTWLQQLQTLHSLSFPRALKSSLPLVSHLHVFCDASAEAFAAAAYIHSRYPDGSHSTVLAQAKGHVSPKQQTSIPRLELLAAELSVKLRQRLVQRVKINIHQVHHWTDSLTVLYWINNDKDRFQLFVHNKLAKIRKFSDPQEWHWVPTLQNPADLPSRGSTLDKLGRDSLWQSGPSFLGDESLWPRPPQIIPSSAVLKELRKEEQIYVANDTSALKPVLDLSRFSSWAAALGTLRCIARWRFSRSSRPPSLYKAAECWLLRQLQLPMLQRFRHASDKHFRKAQGWTKFLPVLSSDGLLRASGRISQAKTLPLDARMPILLDASSPFTVLLIRHIHNLCAHYGGVSYTWSRVSARFWIPAGRQLVKDVLKGCVPCRRRLARSVRPPEGLLPDLRIPDPANTVAFAVTAVDCAGPYRVVERRSYRLYYLVIFTCCHIRAVRLEWLSDLTTDAFLLSLIRAAARGVNPHTVLSDNGGNFDGANRLLRALWQAMPQDELVAKRPDITWRFNPPYASHYGGAFERLIGAAKQALYHAIPEHYALTLEQLATAFYSVEAILNARPLTYTTTDLKDPQPLTPNHFLYGAASQPVLEAVSSLQPMDGCSLVKRWTALHSITNRFAQRFAREVLPALAAFRRLSGTDRDPQPGDVVVFFLPTSARKWPLAMVEHVYPGPDGRVRTLLLRLPQVEGHASQYVWKGEKTFKRDVKDVALLLPAELQAPNVHAGDEQPAVPRQVDEHLAVPTNL